MAVAMCATALAAPLVLAAGARTGLRAAGRQPA